MATPSLEPPGFAWVSLRGSLENLPGTRSREHIRVERGSGEMCQGRNIRYSDAARRPLSVGVIF